MCINFETSITAWIISFISSVYMLANPQIYNNWLPLFILTFTQIQILESIIWAGYNTSINGKATKLLLFFLLMQPLINSYVGYKNTNEKTLFYLTVFFILIIIYEYFSTKNDAFNSTVGPNGHLVWNRYDQNGQSKSLFGNNIIGIIYLIGLFLPFLFMKNNTMKIILILFGLITFSLTRIYYNEEFGSMWCFVSVLLSLVALVSPYMIKN